MGVGGKRQAAIFLGDDHAQEALGLQVVPDVRGQIVAFLRDVPVVDHAARLFRLVVQEMLFFLGQPGARVGEQAAPVGPAAEQFTFPPHRAGFQRVALRVRHLRQHLAVQVEDRGGQQGAADGAHTHRDGGQQHDDGQAEDDCVHVLASMDVGRR
ncbi:hypothetical protein D9M68_689430 [compost metagenome]